MGLVTQLKGCLIVALVIIFINSVFGLSCAQAPGNFGEGVLYLESSDWLYVDTPDDVSNWITMPSGTNTYPSNLIVGSSANWKVSVSANEVTLPGGQTVRGHAVAYDPANGYRPDLGVLNSPMWLIADSASSLQFTACPSVDLSQGGDLVTGLPSSPSQDPSLYHQIPIHFDQYVDWSDKPKPGGFDYQLEITFTISRV